jgi:hypothetical protein
MIQTDLLDEIAVVIAKFLDRDVLALLDALPSVQGR